MLKINPNPTLKEDVKVTIPGDKEPGVMTIIFKYMGEEQYQQFLERAGLKLADDGQVEDKEDGQAEIKTKKPRKKPDQAESFMELVVGWEEIDADFTKENVKIFLNNYPLSFYEILGQYRDLRWTSRIKN
jgi:hypothetical protein